ncbi:MAG: ComF family protein [Chloroflexi bacterium]|nr:ComF family protein [Chloroflexota bacterium]
MIAQFTHDASLLRQALLDLFFPPRCVVCRQIGEWFCAPCRQAINRILPPICQQCGRPLNRTDCPYCQKLPLQINGTRAVAFFEGSVRQAIHALKYNHRPELARPLGALLSDYFSAHPIPADALVPIPLHPEREHARGYNQARLLAQELGRHSNLPVWNDVLTRTRHTRPQVELDAVDRRDNVHDAFVATERVTGARILLIDDVCTTGATMDACGQALQARAAKSVWGLAVARSR